MTDLSLFVLKWWNWIAPLSLQLAALIILVTVVTLALKKAPARARHTLWLLVFIKVLLPPSWSTAWSLGNLWPQQVSAVVVPDAVQNGVANTFELHASLPSLATQNSLPPNAMAFRAFCVWGTGVVIAFAAVIIPYCRLKSVISSLPVIDEGPVRVAVESAAIQLGLQRTPELRLLDRCTSPFLTGIFRPTIVIPNSIVDSLTSTNCARYSFTN